MKLLLGLIDLALGIFAVTLLFFVVSCSMLAWHGIGYVWP